jgi:hypothetical protein
MKLKRNITAAVMALSLVAGVAFAATTTDTQPTTGPGYGYGMMNGQGPHHGANMHGKGMMRGNGPGCAINNGGPGMGPKMMMQGGRGMHRGGPMMNPELVEKRNQFLDATADLRKQIHDKQFSYREASRNSSTTQGELQTQETELYTMRQELQSKRQAIFAAQ